MTMEQLEVINDTTFKYQQKAIEDELPVIKLKQKVWFLWQLINDEWEYLGFWNTKAKMLDFARAQVAIMNNADELYVCKDCVRISETIEDWYGYATVGDSYMLCPICDRARLVKRAKAGFVEE